MIELKATKQYILELEKQNNNLKEDFKRHIDRINELTNRIDKAIEYINKHKKPLHHYFDEPDCDYWIATNPDDILDILKGSDKE